MKKVNKDYEYKHRIQKQPIPVGARVYTDFEPGQSVAINSMMGYNHRWFTISSIYAWNKSLGEHMYKFKEGDNYIFSDTMIQKVIAAEEVLVKVGKLPQI